MNAFRTGITWPELTALLLARLGMLWLVVFVSLLLPSDDLAFYAFMGMAFTLAIPYSLWLKNRLMTMPMTPFLFLVDIVMVTGIVYFSGGIRSEFTLLYPLVILSAAIIGNPKQAAGITMLAVAAYMLTVASVGHAPPQEYGTDGTASQLDTGIAAILLRGLVFAVFGGAGIYIAKKCDFVRVQERLLVNTTYTLLENIPLPALLLSESGVILHANEHAGFALNTSREDLCSRMFTDLRQEPDPPIPESFGHTATLLREKADQIPVSYRTQDFQLPESALLGPEDAGKDTVQVTLLLFTDISEELKTRRQLDKVERITNATRIAGEMAHEIQGPLASLSASLQLLKHYESKATAADWLPNSPRRKDRNELFDHIEDASSRIDTSIKNFVDFAEFSPQDLLSIIKLDSHDEKQGYIDHLNTIGRDLQDGQNSHSG